MLNSGDNDVDVPNLASVVENLEANGDSFLRSILVVMGGTAVLNYYHKFTTDFPRTIPA